MARSHRATYWLLTGLLLGPAANAASSCDGISQRLAAGDGVWRAVNDGQYERTFRFAHADGALTAAVLRPSLRFNSISTVRTEVADGKLFIHFKDERGEHVQQYACSTDAKLRGYADGPTDMGSYSHTAVLYKLDGYVTPEPPKPGPPPTLPGDDTW